MNCPYLECRRTAVASGAPRNRRGPSSQLWHQLFADPQTPACTRVGRELGASADAFLYTQDYRAAIIRGRRYGMTASPNFTPAWIAPITWVPLCRYSSNLEPVGPLEARIGFLLRRIYAGGGWSRRSRDRSPRSQPPVARSSEPWTGRHRGDRYQRPRYQQSQVRSFTLHAR